MSKSEPDIGCAAFAIGAIFIIALVIGIISTIYNDNELSKDEKRAANTRRAVRASTPEPPPLPLPVEKVEQEQVNGSLECPYCHQQIKLMTR